jgi:hypothetical protein
MSGRDTSLTFRQAANARETGEAFLVLLEINHPDISPPVRLSSDAVNTESGGETYTAYPFDLTLPDDQEGASTRARITIDNVHRDLVEAIRLIRTPPTVTIRIVLGSTPDTVEAEFTGFQLTNVGYDVLTIEGDLTVEQFMSEPYPGDSFLPSLFPALF